ncbi:MAG: acylphosphatase [Atopobiaceae bacterium]|jgi:acylphosphatase|nr:acylphosphatase [Atopobiaceae bacterium]
MLGERAQGNTDYDAVSGTDGGECMPWFSRVIGREDPERPIPELGGDARRLHLTYAGECQGVGFRWNAQRLARDNDLTGWVRNQLDGTVEMELQGGDESIGRFQTRMTQAYREWGNVFWIDDSADIPLVSGERDFVVKF